MDVPRALMPALLLLLSGSGLACGSDAPLDEGTYLLQTEDAIAAECEGAEPAFADQLEATLRADGDAFSLGLPGGISTGCTVSDSTFHCDPAVADGEREFHPILETVSWFETTTRIDGRVSNTVQFTATFGNHFRCAGDVEGCDLLVQQITAAVPCDWSQQYEARRIR